MKRIIALALALVLAVSLSITAFAAGETGSITINGVGTNTKYHIYKLLDLESYDVVSGAYSYKAAAAWAAFFATDDAKAYFTTDDAGYVTWTWKAAVGDDTTEEEAVAAFAKMALQYAKANSIPATKSSETAGQFVVTGTSGKFADLELGYYLVDSSMGALCGLTTTNPDASVNAKNAVPVIDKQVQEDSTNQWGAANTADIGQIVEYRVTINVHAGAENYVLKDTMETGLTFEQDPSDMPYVGDPDPVKAAAFRGVWRVEHVIPITGGHETHVAVKDTDYTVTVTDEQNFNVTFSKDFCDHLETNDKVIVYYNAMLNRTATIAGAGNKNTAQLTFGDNGESNIDEVTTYTYRVDVVKTDSQNKLIDGAKFKLYDAATGGNEIAVVILDAVTSTDPAAEYLTDSTGNVLTFNGENVTKINSYRRARADETGVEIVVNNGQVRIVGFDNGTYYLEETEAPDGYNKLTARQKFIVSDGNLDATFNGETFSTGSGVHVVNKTGTMLPETGGMGTVIFVVIGMIVALGTGVLLVTKKRMSMIED